MICQGLLYVFLYVHMSFTVVFDRLSVPLGMSLWSQLSYCVWLCLCQQFFCLSVWSFTFTGKCDCDRVNHVVFMISLTTILVKLLQMIWCYVTSFVICQSVWRFLHIFKRCAIHIIMVLCCIHLILEERCGVPVIMGSEKKN